MELDYAKAASTAPSLSRKPFIEAGIEAEAVVTLAKAIMGGHKGNSFVFEFKYLSAKALANGVAAPPVGAERVYVIDLDNKDYGFPNLMSVAVALNGSPMPGLSDDQKKALLAEGKSIDQITETDNNTKGAALKRLLSEARGMKVRISTSGVETKDKKPFTAISWSHVDQTMDQVRENRAKLDSGAL